MAKVTTAAGDALFYRDDCFAPPWEEPPATLLLHAEGETSLAWYAWLPRLGPRSRVIRPDMRGAGRSVSMEPGQPWSLDRLAGDVVALMDGIGLERAHLVAARLAGPVAIRLAASCPARVATLALCSTTPDPAGDYGPRALRWAEEIERQGLDAWAVGAAQERLGAQAEEAALEGWSSLLAGADAAALAGLFRALDGFDTTGDLAQIACPALVVTTDASPLLPLESTTAWQRRIPGAELLVLTGRGDHVAATHARELAGAVQAFQRRADHDAAGSRRRERATAREGRERRRDERAAGRARRG
jgi:3-oxoadipate enol-lactonase